MPYHKKKQVCTRSDGTKGSYVLSYTDKKGKKHRACHKSKKSAQGQIAAIEANESVDLDGALFRDVIRGMVAEVLSSDLDERKDYDVDGDDDEDAADYMMNRMMKGGLPKGKAFKKSRKFDE